MDIIQYSIRKPVTILAVVILVLLFGVISLNRLPYQLSPTVIEPEVTVTTTWRGATPYEMEREVVEEQENVLKSIPSLLEMESDSANGRSTVTLRFMIGTGVDDALLRVSSKLNEVDDYPDGVDNPVISATGATTRPVAWVMLEAMEGNPQPVGSWRSYFENEVRHHLERIEGVASLMVGGGVREEMHVIVDPARLAAYRVTISDITRSLATENVNVAAGTLGVGRRSYRIRTTAEFKSPQGIAATVIRSTGQRRVLLGDVAEVRHGYQRVNATVLHNGMEGIIVGFRPEHGANVLRMTAAVKKTVKHLNETLLRPRKIEFVWLADQTSYITGAIGIIKENILIGGLLAIGVLLLFLRSLRATVVVSTTIPISIVGTFLFMDMLGRNLNVVSLAGIAFAVGMLVDNAIVVIENIDRHRRMGKSGLVAAYEGTTEVWGAILSSTLTTVAVFLPVVFLQDEAGQLFRDVAIAVVFAISLSLFVSVSVIPMFAAKLFGKKSGRPAAETGLPARCGRAASGLVMGGVGLALRNAGTRIATVTLLVLAAVAAMMTLVPKMEYLPQGNRNFILTMVVPPPGLSQAERQEIGQSLFRRMQPHLEKEHQGYPQVLNVFFVGADRYMFISTMARDWSRAAELIPLLKKQLAQMPGMFGVVMQVGIFQAGLARGRTVDIDISGADMTAIVRTAGALFGKIRQTIPGAQVRPVPSIELSYPEVNILPDRERLTACNMSSRDLGIAVDAMLTGRKVGEYKAEGHKKIDLILKTDDADVQTPEELFNKLVVVPGGKAIPISSLAQLSRTSGMSRIRHLERRRTITLQVTPPLDIPLETAMETIREDIIEPFAAGGRLKNVDARMSGAAGKLTVARRAMQWNFLLAAIIAYLLMASLFGNFIYPLIIMVTVPLAGAGGLLGLRLLNTFITPQPMDILTMLGFVILIGVVVNNAILIVHQSLNNVRCNGMPHDRAVLEATRSRLRPIYMSAVTSIFGMLPLVVFQGAGTELYKGLGSVLLGGIAVSTVFTVFVIPSILLFVIRMEKPDGRRKLPLKRRKEAQP